jgi:hypothetical protein
VAAATIGELYVDYDIVLFTPQMSAIPGGRWYNNAGLDADNLVGDNPPYALSGQLPVQWTSTSTFTFTQDWEGMVGLQVVGVAIIADITDTGTATVTVASSDFTAAATSLTAVLAVQATRGQTMILHEVGGGAVTTCWMSFAPAPYRFL